jgi:purine nucleosidase
MTPRPLILDVDTGVDDALAILYAVASPEVDLRAVTCTYGNVPLDLVVRNTLAVLEAAGRGDVEVAAGAAAPLIEPPKHGYEVHGPEGLGNASVPRPRSSASARDAVQLLIAESKASPGELLVVSTGPLTNIALALREEPTLLSLVGGYTLMAGAFRGRGNTLPRSEANVWFDPEAAAEVLAAVERHPIDPLPLAIGLDVTEEVVLRRDDVDAICAPAPDSALAGLIRDATDFYIAFETSTRPEVGGCFLHDPLAVAAAIDPSLVTTATCHVEVELEGRHTRGETVADFLEMWRHPQNVGYGLTEAPDNLRAALLVDERAFESRLTERLRSLVEACA